MLVIKHLLINQISPSGASTLIIIVIILMILIVIIIINMQRAVKAQSLLIGGTHIAVFCITKSVSPLV